MRLAYVSPLTPAKTGIADFSKKLVNELIKFVKIDLFTDRCNETDKSISSKFNVFDIEKLDDKFVREKYDFIIYHLGNNYTFHYKIMEYILKYPGVVEIHDLSIHNAVAHKFLSNNNYEGYINEMEFCHGAYGKKVAQDFINGIGVEPWKNDFLKFTLIKRYLENAKGIIVHSDLAKQYIIEIANDKAVQVIPLSADDIIENNKESQKMAREKLKFDDDTFIIGSFGFMNSNKRINEILETLARIKNDGYNFRYYVVGEIQDKAILDNIKLMGLENHVLVTGFVKEELYKQYCLACDLCVNLRYPSQGESSASVNNMLGLGKAVIVTDIGSFSEYPDNVVKKIKPDSNEIENLYCVIRDMIKNKDHLISLEQEAFLYAKYRLHIKKNVKLYIDFFNDLLAGSFSDSYVDYLVNILMELNVANEKYIDNFSEILDQLFLGEI